MAVFQGQLRSNEIFSALYNMIISQEVFADNIKGADLVDKARVDGGLYGDTKLYYSTDALKSAPWGNDAEATNLLALHRPDDPECQAISLDVFRQISLTVDNYLSKRAWSTEGAFSSFNSVMLGWLRDTKKVYDGTLYNVFIGTAEGAANKALVEVGIAAATTGLTGEEKARVEAETIAEAIADLLVEMGDYNRDFNDYKQLRRYSMDEIKVIWNSKFVNKIKKIDMPTMFHKDGLVDKFDEEVLPARYFGHITSSADVGSGLVLEGNKVHGTVATVRAMVEKDFKVGDVDYHVFPGDILPDNTTVGGSTASFKYAEAYVECPDIICKVVTKLPPYMSAFEVGTSFFNPKSLTENHYLTFGHNTIEYLKAYPMITVEAD